MDKAIQSMVNNLEKNTGKNLAQWIALVHKENFAKHGEIIAFLKTSHGLTHGFANLVAHKSKGSDADSASDVNALVEKQYVGKEHFRPLYEKLLKEIRQFGNDVEIAPKNGYVSVRRKKQFAILQPATKTRFEIGLNLKGEQPSGKLTTITAANAMCSHKIDIADIKDIDPELVAWIRKAYDNAG